MGNPDDVAPVGDGMSEMKIDCGYRIYYRRTARPLY